jgi:CHAD domain-containing protein
VAADIPQAPSPAALKAVARAELRSLAAALRKTTSGQSVHGARRQIKRLRSLMRLLRNPIGEEAFQAANDALRSAADALAGQRRAEALVAAAGRLGGGSHAHMSWRQIAEAHRDAHVAGPAGESGPQAAGKAIKAAAEIVRGLRLQPSAAPDIGDAFLATYRKARKRLDHGLSSGSAEDLHTARKHVIHHIHHLDLLRAQLTHPAKRIAALEKLREALGDLNDLDELCQLAADGKASLPDTATRAVAKRRAMLLKRAEKAAGRLFRHKPKAFQKRIGAMWALTEP